jgi:hypothetical protein
MGQQKNGGLYMCIQRSKIRIWLIVLGMALVLGSCVRTKSDAAEITESNTVEIIESYAAEIADLNGTWQNDWFYQANLKLPEEERGRIMYDQWEYSWGTGMRTNAMFCIDMGDAKPFLDSAGDGRFWVTAIRRTGKDSLKVNAYRGDLNEPKSCWFLEFIFHFIDKDTIWIECKEFEKFGGTLYGKGALWHRMSGPEGYYRWRVLE